MGCRVCGARVESAGELWLDDDGLSTGGLPTLHLHQPSAALAVPYGAVLAEYDMRPEEAVDLLLFAESCDWPASTLDAWLTVIGRSKRRERDAV